MNHHARGKNLAKTATKWSSEKHDKLSLDSPMLQYHSGLRTDFSPLRQPLLRKKAQGTAQQWGYTRMADRYLVSRVEEPEFYRTHGTS